MRILAASGKCHNANLSFALQPFLTPGVLASFAGDFAFRGPEGSDPGGPLAPGARGGPKNRIRLLDSDRDLDRRVSRAGKGAAETMEG
jgi:hypothetical protein